MTRNAPRKPHATTRGEDDERDECPDADGQDDPGQFGVEDEAQAVVRLDAHTNSALASCLVHGLGAVEHSRVRLRRKGRAATNPRLMQGDLDAGLLRGAWRGRVASQNADPNW
jgi:hypothetical protein